jgi:hypothetical protein
MEPTIMSESRNSTYYQIPSNLNQHLEQLEGKIPDQINQAHKQMKYRHEISDLTTKHRLEMTEMKQKIKILELQNQLLF